MPKSVSALRKLEVQVSSLLSKVNGMATMPNRAGTGGRQKRRARNRLRRQSQVGRDVGAAGPSSRSRMGQSASLAGSLNVSAPSSVGVVVSNSYFRMEGKAQQNTEIAGMGDSVRVVGCDLFSQAVASGASGNNGFGVNNIVGLSPNGISPRLRNLEELFQYYAIRALMIQYIPNTGSTAAVSVALGVLQSADDASSVSYTTQQQVLELTPSVLTPAWQSAMIVYRHTGSKLWRTTSIVSGSVEEYIQADMVGLLLGNAASTTYGQIRMEYVIDFYKSTPIQSTPSLGRSGADAVASYNNLRSRWLSVRGAGSKDARGPQDDNKERLMKYDDTDVKVGSAAAPVSVVPPTPPVSPTHSLYFKIPNPSKALIRELTPSGDRKEPCDFKK